uniref:NADH dehydrogenase [ubiquinone] 1 alpha subcomplex subunit 2 n=1 Tax=Syphacia muris TaxID=451379 RepID=A0A158R5B8_9BILA
MRQLIQYSSNTTTIFGVIPVCKVRTLEFCHMLQLNFMSYLKTLAGITTICYDLEMPSAIKLGAGLLRELRIHLCQKSPGSVGIRDFIEHDYVPLKRANANFPILIRECSGISARIFARYKEGVEKCVSLEGFSRQKVLNTIEELAKK